MGKNLEILSHTPLFNGIRAEQLREIERIVSEKFYTKGEIIFSEGDDGNGFYIVADGKVKIYKVSMDGKEQILHIYGPGNPFGEVPVFSGDKFPANAEPLQKSRILFLPRKNFIDLISRHPSLAMNMMAVLSMRLRQFTIQIENLSLKEIPGRLAGYLLYLAAEQEYKNPLELPISKGQLASLLGTIPETLSRILSKMTEVGIINVAGPRITVLAQDRLEDLAGNGKL